jgi:malate dehydrogenase (oxaloacetate-decarboxylating)
MKNIYEESIKLHKKKGGKLEIVSKVSLKNKKDLSLAYTPGVAGVCQKIANNKETAKQLTLKKDTVAIVSDGSAILGLGNLGPLAAIPVMEGKAAIFKKFGNVNAFPICLDTQDTLEIIKTVKYLAPVFGGINLEDISAPRCFEIEERLRNELSIPVMHDDQWGAATVTLSALINSLRVSQLNKKNVIVVVSGVGAAGIATGRLLHLYGIRNTIFCDSKGIINSERKDLSKEKNELLNGSQEQNRQGGLEEALRNANVFIGLSKPNILNDKMIRTMASNPIIFALANPVPEIMPEKALKSGALIVATGRSDYPNQINNSLVFPAFFRALLDLNINKFDNNIFIKIAEALADTVKKPIKEKIISDMFDPKVFKAVYGAIKKYNKK